MGEWAHKRATTRAAVIGQVPWLEAPGWHVGGRGLHGWDVVARRLASLSQRYRVQSTVLYVGYVLMTFEDLRRKQQLLVRWPCMFHVPAGFYLILSTRSRGQL